MPKPMWFDLFRDRHPFAILFHDTEAGIYFTNFPAARETVLHRGRRYSICDRVSGMRFDYARCLAIGRMQAQSISADGVWTDNVTYTNWLQYERGKAYLAPSTNMDAVQESTHAQ